MASAAVHQCRFFFAGRMAPEVGEARMTTDAAKIAVSGLRECDAEFVTIMASLALADENVRLGSGRGAPCERDPCGAENTEKRDDCHPSHVVSRSHESPPASVPFFRCLLFRNGEPPLPSFHAAEQSRHFKSFSRQIACCNK
jgi:hypothetical protein